MAEKKDLTTAERKQFDVIKDRLVKAEANYANRNSMYDDIENIFLMEWSSDKPSQSEGNHIKFTVSPDSRNKALGAIRLMSSTNPNFSVPSDANDRNSQEQANKIEKVAKAMYETNNRIRGGQAHYDLISSAVLFAEMQIGIEKTVDWVDYAKGSGKAAEKRMERIASMTPIVFQVFDPRTGYPEYDEFGLSSYFRKVETKVGLLKDKWGERAKNILLTADRNDDATYCEYWDNQFHICWIDDVDKHLLFADHNLPVIPIVAAVTDGSSIHANEEHKRQPFLYSMWKSNLAIRQNLMLTVAYSNMFAIASNPTFNFVANSEDRKLRPDYSVPGGYNKLLQGESFGPLNKNAIDPAIVQSWEWAKGLTTESTMYEQALGSPMGGNAAYSTYALLGQSGRTPLITIQRRGSFAIAQMMEKAFILLKDLGGTNKVKSKDAGTMDIAADEIPDDLIIDADLRIDLPQDKKMAIQIAVQATSGEHPLLDYEEARKLFLDEEQSDEIDKRIAREQFVWAKFQQMMMEMLQPPAPPVPPEAQTDIQNQVPPPVQRTPQEQDIPPELMQQIMAEQGQGDIMGGGVGMGNPMGEPMPGEGEV